ncbi:MAG: serine hydrolase [Gammaproteobacteria bacterium]|nr:serine hydrolase [Gammaproteobacteria bacterium]
MPKPKSIARVFAVVTNCLLAAASLAAPSEADIDQIVKRSLDAFAVPGMSVSVVYDGKTLYAKGHGVLEIDKTARVDEKTLFQIASVSKAFTAAALAILVDDGKLHWDDPVIDYLPEFRMYDPWVTREFTIRDLLTHRSGLPIGAGDLLLFPEAQSSRDEIIHALRFLKPGTSFRSEFAYDNLMYIVAGELVGRVSGASFEEFLESRLLHPVGMSDCSATLNRAGRHLAKATPHVEVDGTLQTTLSLESDTGAAAGGINCSARSMALWASFIMSKGKNADGEQIISAAQVDELLKPVTLLPSGGYAAQHTGAFLNAYALGWNVSTFYGQPFLSHSGGLWGMTTFLTILPEQGLAVFVSNNKLSPAPRAVANEIIDRFLRDLSPDAGKDWIGIVSDAMNARSSGAAEVVAASESSRRADSTPSLPLEAYVGTYRDPWYGDIAISLQADGKLWFRSARSAPLSGPLEHFQFDTFIARWTERKYNNDAYVSFSLGANGDIERIRMKAVSPATDFSFDFHDLDLVRIAE